MYNENSIKLSRINVLRILEIKELLASIYKSETILALQSRNDLIQMIVYTGDRSQSSRDESAPKEETVCPEDQKDMRSCPSQEARHQ